MIYLVYYEGKRNDVTQPVFTNPPKNWQEIEELKSFYKRQEKNSAKNPSNGQNRMKQSRRGMNAEKSG